MADREGDIEAGTRGA